MILNNKTVIAIIGGLTMGNYNKRTFEIRNQGEPLIVNVMSDLSNSDKSHVILITVRYLDIDSFESIEQSIKTDFEIDDAIGKEAIIAAFNRFKLQQRLVGTNSVDDWKEFLEYAQTLINNITASLPSI